MRLSTGRLARGCARHPWLTIGIWLAAGALAVFFISRLLGSALTSEMTFTREPDSQKVRNLIAARLRGPEKINEVIIVSSPDATVDSPEFKSAVNKMRQDVSDLGSSVVSGGISYYQTHDPSMVSADRHTTIIPVVMSGGLAQAEKNIDKLEAVLDRDSRQTGFQMLTTGVASTNNDFNKLSETDLQRAELIGIPIAMIILILVFGTLATAGLPLLLAGFSIVIAVGITAVVGQAFEMSFFVVNMITMMGMAVGIDYSLFVVSRYREEMMRGHDKLEAIGIAGATASKAVLFSGMTVILALAGMLIVPMSLFYSLAAGAIFVVSVSVLAALTLLPAVLGLLGGKVNSLRVPFVHRYQPGREGEAGQGRFWDWATRTVMRRPLLSAVVAICLLAFPALFYFQIRTGANGVAALPDSFKSKQGFEILSHEFSSGLTSPVEVTVDGNINSPAVKEAMARLQDEVKQDSVFNEAPKVETDGAGDLAVISFPVAGGPESETATGAVKRLRETYVPQAFAGVDASVLVGGLPAINLDYFNLTDEYRPIVFAFVLGLSFLLLLVVFHSLIVPLKAIIMNLLSVGAAYGLIVLVFQKGIGASVFHFQQVDVVEAWVPLFLFSVLFGLSMDYHVFLLGRIRENYMLTGDNSGSVAAGLRSTGRIITGAALIMVVVFSGFASGQLVMFQQMGFGLAVAVLLDATVVRSVLVPATMKLLGDRNWYLPRWLKWLPDFHFEGESAEKQE